MLSDNHLFRSSRISSFLTAACLSGQPDSIPLQNYHDLRSDKSRRTSLT